MIEDPFASPTRLAAALDRKRAKVVADRAAARDAWRRHPEAGPLLATLQSAVHAGVEGAGVASLAAVTAAVGAALGAAPTAERRLVHGLVAVALDADDARALTLRRRGPDVVLLARDPALLDAAANAAAALDEALGAVGDDVLLAPGRVAELARLTAPALSTVPDEALADVVVAAAQLGRLSGRGEVHRVDLPPAAAVRHALAGLSPTEPLTAAEVRDRVRARFPALAPLPARPDLDAVLDAAGLGLVYDEQRSAYRARALPTDTTGFSSRVPTRNLPADAVRLLAAGELGVRLDESARTRSFLALAVGARDVERAQGVLAQRFGARVVDLTGVLLDAVQRAAGAAGVPWDLVLAADAAPAGTRERQGLATLVSGVLTEVQAAVAAALADSSASGAPVLLTELGALARYGHLGLLATWTDLAARRPVAVWALLPQLGADQGAVVDGRPVPLAAPGQLVRLDHDWLVASTVEHSGA